MPRRAAAIGLLAGLLLAGCGYTRIGGWSPAGRAAIWLQPVVNRTMPFEPDVEHILDRALADELVARGYDLAGPDAPTTLHVRLDEYRESTLVQDASGGRRDGVVTVVMNVVWTGPDGSLLDGGVESVIVRASERFSIALGETPGAARREAFRRVAPRVADVLRSKAWNPPAAGGNESDEEDAESTAPPVRGEVIP